MKNIKSFSIYLFLPLLFYPAYFSVTNIVDSALGDQQLINWLTFDSHSLFLKVFFRDWVASLPMMYGILLIILLPLKSFLAYIGKYSPALIIAASTLIAIVISIIVGFGWIATASNALSMILIASIFYITSQFARSNTHDYL